MWGDFIFRAEEDMGLIRIAYDILREIEMLVSGPNDATEMYNIDFCVHKMLFKSRGLRVTIPNFSMKYIDILGITLS